MHVRLRSALPVLAMAIAATPLRAHAVSLCPPQPATCRQTVASGTSFVKLVRAAECRHNELRWKWLKGAATEKLELGDPVATDDYALCLYDGTGLLFEADVPSGCPGSLRCWKEGRTFVQYRSKQNVHLPLTQYPPDGIRKMLVKAGADGKASITVQGRGCRVFHDTTIETDGLAALVSPLVVQLHTSAGEVCWGASFAFPPALEHADWEFKDQSD